MHSPSTLIRLRDDAGKGSTVVLLVDAGSAPAPAAALLAHEFRVLTFEIGSGAAQELAQELSQAIARVTSDPAGLIAISTTAQLALALALGHPQSVNAIALLAPPLFDQSSDQPLLGKLSGLTTPVLALFGARDASSPPGKRMRQAIPNCNVTYVYDVGSDIAQARPEAVAAALSEFMRTRERYLVTTKSSKLYP